jgi:hypothetical protein
MNKRIIISLVLLAGLAGLAIFMNFNRSVEAAYLGTSSLPAGTDTQTLRFNSGAWEASSALTNDGSNVTVSGNVTATSFIYSSDARLKKDVEVLDGALEKVSNLEGVSFTWKDSEEKEIGLIAQDVENIVPELVVTGKDDMKAVKYGNIVALLIEAVKEQQAEIDTLKAELESIK